MCTGQSRHEPSMSEFQRTGQAVKPHCTYQQQGTAGNRIDKVGAPGPVCHLGPSMHNQRIGDQCQQFIKQ